MPDEFYDLVIPLSVGFFLGKPRWCVWIMADWLTSSRVAIE
jgi:hypothetical protein